MESEEIKSDPLFLFNDVVVVHVTSIYIRLNIEWEGNYEYCMQKAEEVLACELDQCKPTLAPETGCD